MGKALRQAGSGGVPGITSQIADRTSRIASVLDGFVGEGLPVQVESAVEGLFEQVGFVDGIEEFAGDGGVADFEDDAKGGGEQFEGEIADELGVAGVQAVGEADEAGEERGALPVGLAEGREVVVLGDGEGFAVVAGDGADDESLAVIEGEGVGVEDDVECAFVVFAFTGDVADVVEERAELHECAFLITEVVHVGQLIEERGGQAGDVMGVLFVVAASFGQVDGGIEQGHQRHDRARDGGRHVGGDDVHGGGHRVCILA